MVTPGCISASRGFTKGIPASGCLTEKGALRGIHACNHDLECLSRPCPALHVSTYCTRVSHPLHPTHILPTNRRSAAVSWSSPEAPAVASLAPASSATDPALPAGTLLLSVPPSALPHNLPSLSVTATLDLAGVSGVAATTVQLNSAPYCTLTAAADGSSGSGTITSRSSSSSPCLTLTLLSDTFPAAVMLASAAGWADGQDTQLRYEFGLRTTTTTASGTTSTPRDAVQQLGSSPSATLLGLPLGASTPYVCVYDSQGGRACAAGSVVVQPPGAGFNASAALAEVDVAALANVSANSVAGLAAADPVYQGVVATITACMSLSRVLHSCQVIPILSTFASVLKCKPT